jgi:CBS domain-containing protein
MHEIEEIMSTDVVSVTPDTPVSKVIELLVENDITGIPVVDSDDRLVGIVTEKDVMGVLSGPEETSGHVRDYMTDGVVGFDQNDDVIAVCECLVNNHFRRVPVLNEGHLVGIISRRDLIKYIIEPIRS